MASSEDVRSSNLVRRALLWSLAAGALVAAAFAAMLLTAGESAAQPLRVPGIGSESPVVIDISGAEPSASVESVAAEAAVPTSLPEIQLSVRAGIPGIEISVPEAPPGIEIPLPDTLPRIELPFLSGIPGFEILEPVVTPKKSTGEVAVDAALGKLGAGYGSGSDGPDSFDCSGLVQWSYEQAGVEVPRTSYGQLAAGTPVELDELRPGDLVSFYGGGHSALYAGDGKVVHASTHGTGVVLSEMSEMPVCGARRF